MSKRLSVLWMCAVLLASCSPVVAPTSAPTSTPTPTLTASATATPTLVPTLTPVLTLTSTPTPGYPADLAISMDRGNRYWGCGERLKIEADGEAVYERSCSWGVAEKNTAKITPEQIQELVTAIDKANIWAIDDQLDAPGTDMAPLAISVTLNGRSKAVSRYDVLMEDCRATYSWLTPVPGREAFCKLGQTIDRITKSLAWVAVTGLPPTPRPTRTPLATPTPVISSAKVSVTVYVDQNGNGTPGPGEGLNNIPVELQLPNGKTLAAITQQGVAAFDMRGTMAGTRITVSLPNLYRSYQFFLPQSGTVPILFSFAQPTVPTKSP